MPMHRVLLAVSMLGAGQPVACGSGVRADCRSLVQAVFQSALPHRTSPNFLQSYTHKLQREQNYLGTLRSKQHENNKKKKLCIMSFLEF